MTTHDEPLVSLSACSALGDMASPCFAFVCIRREEDLLDLAPFLADNSRLGEGIVTHKVLGNI